MREFIQHEFVVSGASWERKFYEFAKEKSLTDSNALSFAIRAMVYIRKHFPDNTLNDNAKMAMASIFVDGYRAGITEAGLSVSITEVDKPNGG